MKYTDEEILKAIKKSAIKWYGIELGTGIDKGVENCALCEKFFDKIKSENTCSGCPVFGETSKMECGGTPYTKWRKHHRLEHIKSDNLKAECHKCKKIAYDFKIFLEDLAYEYEEKHLSKKPDYQHLVLGAFYLPDKTLVRVIEQTHREEKFGNNGAFKASNGKKIKSIAYISNILNDSNIFLVMGSNKYKDTDYAEVTNEDLDDLRLMVREYNVEYADLSKMKTHYADHYKYDTGKDVYVVDYEIIY